MGQRRYDRVLQSHPQWSIIYGVFIFFYFLFFIFGTEPKNLRPVILRNNQIEPGLPGTVVKPMRDLDPHRKESRTFTAGPKPRPPRGALEQVPYQVQHVTGRGRGGLNTRPLAEWT